MEWWLEGALGHATAPGGCLKLLQGTVAGNLPPMGGKSTESSIRKQSVPHMLTICKCDFGIDGRFNTVVWRGVGGRVKRANGHEKL
jgi:hypothetical protein